MSDNSPGRTNGHRASRKRKNRGAIALTAGEEISGSKHQLLQSVSSQPQIQVNIASTQNGGKTGRTTQKQQSIQIPIERSKERGDDERRLLPSYETPPDAVAIIRPGSKVLHTMPFTYGKPNKVSNGSFQPRNNLTRAKTPNNPVESRETSSFNQRKFWSLDSSQYESTAARNKRQKTSSSPIEIPDSQGDDSVAQLRPAELVEHVEAILQPNRQSSSNGSRKPACTLPDFGKATEYNRLEALLKHRRSQTDRLKSSRRSEVSLDETSQIPSANLLQQPTRFSKRRRLAKTDQQIEDVEEYSANNSPPISPKIPYMSTATPRTSKRKSKLLRDSGPKLQLTTAHTSPYFDLGDEVSENLLKPSKSSKHASKPIEIDDDDQDKAARSSIKRNGRTQASGFPDESRRATHESLLGSEDELERLNDFEGASRANRSDQASSRSQLVDKFIRNLESDRAIDPVFSQGTIKPTVFTASKSQRAVRPLSSRMRAPQSGFPVRAIRNRNFESDGHEDVVYKYDSTEEAFIPTGMPQTTLDLYPNLIIRPTKINKIKHGAENPALIQLILARTNDDPDHTIDLVMQESSVGRKFLEVIQMYSGTLKVETLTGDQMLQLFKRRSEKVKDWTSPSDTGGSSTRINNKLPIDSDNNFTHATTTRRSSHDLFKRPTQIKSVQLIEEGRSRRAGLFADPFENKQSLRSQLVGDTEDERQSRGSVEMASKRCLRSSETTKVIEHQVYKYSRVHGLGKPWRLPLVYPTTGRDRATVDFEDLERLDEDEWLNDNLIVFYLKYLENQIHRETTDRVYVFNTFFHKQLTDLKGLERGSVINYEKVQKWTKVDIFEYDFLVVPICENAHWWVAIICNLPHLARRLLDNKDNSSQASGKVDESTIAQRIISGAEAQNEPQDVETSRESKISMEDVDQSSQGVARLSIQDGVDAGLIPSSIVEASGDLREVTAWEGENTKEHENSLSRKSHSSPSPVDMVPTISTSRTAETSSQKTGKRRSLPPSRKYDPKSPIIISFDSLNYARGSELRQLKEFIIREGESKKSLPIKRDDLQGMKATGIPHQDTVSDCGVYLLGYMEKFLRNPRGLITKVLQRELDAEKDWPGLDANKMRAEIRDVIFNVHSEQEEGKNGSKKTPKSKTKTQSQDLYGLESFSAKPTANGVAAGSIDSAHIVDLPPEQHIPLRDQVRQSRNDNVSSKQQEIDSSVHYQMLPVLLAQVDVSTIVEALKRLDANDYDFPILPREFQCEFMPSIRSDEEVEEILKCCTRAEISRYAEGIEGHTDILSKISGPKNIPSSPPLQTPRTSQAPSASTQADQLPSASAKIQRSLKSMVNNESDDDVVEFIGVKTASPVAARPKRKRRSSSERLQEGIWSKDGISQIINSRTSPFSRSTRSSQSKEKACR